MSDKKPIWVQAAELITEGCGWTGTARTMGGALSEQIRIVREPDGRWLGITGSPFHAGVTLHVGRTNADGSYADAEAESDVLYGLNAGRLVAATRELWARLDDGDAKHL